ncbi:hypothetical protein LTR08_008738 [Meristemomyces frigidus]|nr:hypothetical protein LTR08_008738 [Meristemomyces frigidus]
MASPPPDATPVERVFGVMELLEPILLELSMPEMAKAQEVCKQWKSVVEGSLPIRRALYLEPGRASDTKCRIVAHRHWKWPRYTAYAWHPAFESKVLSEMPMGNLATADTYDTFRKMYITQPPAFMETIQFHCSRPSPTYDYDIDITVDCEAGETFGSLLEKLKRGNQTGEDIDGGSWPFWICRQ